MSGDGNFTVNVPASSGATFDALTQPGTSELVQGVALGIAAPGTTNPITYASSTNPLPVGNSALTELGAAINASRLDVSLANVGTTSAVNVAGAVSVSGTVAATQSGAWSADVSGSTVAVTNAGLTELAAAINANRLDVNLANVGTTDPVNVAGAVTVSGTVAATQSGAWTADVSGSSVTVSGAVTVSGTADVSGSTVAVTNAGLTELAAAINANRLDINLANVGTTQPVNVAGAVTVSGTVAATQSGAWTVDASGSTVTLGGPVKLRGGSTVTAHVLDLPGSNDALAVAIMTSTGGHVNNFGGGGGGGTASTDDSAFTAGTDQGTPAMGFNSTDTVAANRVGVLGMDSNRRLRVAIDADNVGIGGGIQYAEGTTVPTITGTAMLYEAAGNVVRVPSTANRLPVAASQAGAWTADVSGSTVTVAGTVAATQSGAWTVAATQSGAWAVDASGSTISVTNAGLTELAAAINTNRLDVNLANVGTTQPVNVAGAVTVSGTVAATQSGAWTVDASGSTVTVAGTVAATQSGAWTVAATQSGAWSADVSGSTISVTNAGLTELAAAINANRLDVNLANVGTTDAINVAGAVTVSGTVAATQSGAWAVDASGSTVTVSGTVDVAGTIADNAPDSGSPVKIGARAVAFDETDPGSVAEDDRVDLTADLNRRLYVNGAHPNGFSGNESSTAIQTNNLLEAAPGAGLRLYVTDVTMNNGSTAAMELSLVESTNANAIYGPFTFAGPGGGLTKEFKQPLRLPENVQLGWTASAVGGAAVSVNGYIAP